MTHPESHIYDGFPCFLTVSHSDEDVDRIIQAFKSAVYDMQAGGFFPEPANRAFEAGLPPVPTARLGRDQHGNPAWYVTNGSNGAGYVLVETS